MIRYNIRRRDYDGRFNLWALYTDYQLGIETDPESPYADYRRWVVVSVHDTRKQAFRAMDSLTGGKSQSKSKR